MNYNLLIIPSAQKELGDLPAVFYEKVKAAIFRLASEPRPRGSRKLSGRPGWRIRVGDYRIVYEIDNSAHSVTVLNVGHRRDVYR